YGSDYSHESGAQHSVPTRRSAGLGVAGVRVAVDGLTEQRHLPHAGVAELLDLREDLGGWPVAFGTTGIRHDAEGAAFVAALHHRSEEHTSEVQSRANVVSRLLLAD